MLFSQLVQKILVPLFHHQSTLPSTEDLLQDLEVLKVMSTMGQMLRQVCGLALPLASYAMPTKPITDVLHSERWLVVVGTQRLLP